MFRDNLLPMIAIVFLVSAAATAHYFVVALMKLTSGYTAVP
ncbi:MAG: hypothetical protein ACP5R4_04945 [Armatimonadota bacterium]